MMLLSETSTESLLPLKLQEYLWQQTSLAFKSELRHGKYESSCTALERMLMGGKTKELKVRLPEVYAAINSISRWTFVKGALPYVIHGCANILQQRRRPKLDLNDKLSPSVTKLFATLHWLLLESAEESCQDGTHFPMPLIEMFVQTVVPHMTNLFETDLILTLQPGAKIWLPLWAHRCPLETYFALPILSSQGATLVAAPEMNYTATYFDVAVLKVLSLSSWNLKGYRWGTIYLQNYLFNYLLRLGFTPDTSDIMLAVRKQPKKSSAISFDFDLLKAQPAKNIAMSSGVKFNLNTHVPDSLKKIVSIDGELSTVYILNLVKVLIKREDMLSMTANLVNIIAMISELFVAKTFGPLLSHGGSLIGCFMTLFKSMGCENRCRFRGFKNTNARHLLHKYFNRVLHADLQASRIFFEKDFQYENRIQILTFVHALVGLCCIYHSMDEEDSLLIDAEYLRAKDDNETLIFSWVGYQLLERIATPSGTDWLSSAENVLLIVEYVKYVHVKHKLVYRKVLMAGLLNSFDKSKTWSAPQPSLITLKDVVLTHKDTSLLSTSEPTKLKKPKFNQKKFNLKLWHAAKAVDEQSDSTHSLSNITSLSSTTTTAGGITAVGAGTTPESVNASASFLSQTSQIAEDLGSTSMQQNKGKLVNVSGLQTGLKHLRMLLNLNSPGFAVDDVMVAAMLDLEAPVIARAAYLLELAYFVRRCNKGEWPVSITNIPTEHTNPSVLHRFKHQAGVMFHKWGVAVGKKLEDMMATDRTTTVEDELTLPIMYQGHKSLLSSHCPHSLRYVACLLLLEITAFLRETFSQLQHHVSITQPPDSPRSRSNTGDYPGQQSSPSAVASLEVPKKHSITTSPVIKKFQAIQRRKSSFGNMLSTNNKQRSLDGKPIIQSPSRVKRLTSHTPLTMGSPKVSRSYSRRVSLPAFDKPVQLTSMDHPAEDINYAWLNTVIKMTARINHLCVHRRQATNCEIGCPVKCAQQSAQLKDAFRTLYEGFEDESCSKDSHISYLNATALSLSALPFEVLCRGSLVMDTEQLQESMRSAWEVLVFPDQHTNTAAASLILVASNRLGESAGHFLIKKFSQDEVDARIKAILSFGTLWSNQNLVYEHLEETARLSQRVPPPKVEYALPSRSVGEPPDVVPDAPWSPHAHTVLDYELTDDWEQSTQYFYNDSEKQQEVKQQRRLKHLQKLRCEYLLTGVPFSFQASLEYNELPPLTQDDEDVQQLAQEILPFFPEPMNEGIHCVIRLLDDTSVSPTQKISVSNLAHEVIWKCMVDRPDIFFRKFFEQMTKHKNQGQLVLMLRKLLLHFPLLPPDAAHILTNNLIGMIIYHSRVNKDKVHETVADITSLLHQIVPSVAEMNFLPIKQSLCREHIEHILLTTANVVGAKDVIVACPNKEKISVFEGMTFQQLLNHCKDIHQNHSEEDGSDLWLVDKHSETIMENEKRVREVLIYKRGHPCPLLKLKKIDQHSVQQRLQMQAFTNRQLLINQVLFTNAIFDAVPSKKSANFLFDELYQLGSFSHKVISLPYEMCAEKELGKQIFSTDVIYKRCWVQLLWKLLDKLHTSTTYLEEAVDLLLDAINGALLVHAEDVLILRPTLAAYLNVALTYSKIFSISGYSEIVPTLLKVYSFHENNVLVKQAIEFTVSQFYVVHQSPFLLQLLANSAPILACEDAGELSGEQQTELIPAHCLFALIESLEHTTPDTLDVLQLVKSPIKPSEFCIDDEATRNSSKIDLCVRLALTIIAYKPDSNRALQMMFVLSTLLPLYVRRLEEVTSLAGESEAAWKVERRQVKQLITYVATIIDQNALLNSPYTSENSNSVNVKTTEATSTAPNRFTTWFRQWFTDATVLDDQEYVFERDPIFGEFENPIRVNPANVMERQRLDAYYRPRTVLLSLASGFILNSTARYNQLLNNSAAGKQNKLVKSVIVDDQAMVLLDIAAKLLTLVLRDHDVLSNIGLNKFLLEAMPLINWTDHLVPFGSIIKEINKILYKIIRNKKNIMKCVLWDGMEVLIRGVYLTLKKQEYLAEICEMKPLLTCCTRIVICDQPQDNSPVVATETTEPPSEQFGNFTTTVVKLCALLLYARPKIFTLETQFASTLHSGNSEKVERFVRCVLLPLAVRMGTGRYDYPQMNVEDSHCILTVLTSLLSPSTRKSGGPRRANEGSGGLFEMLPLQRGVEERIPQNVVRTAFLGFKILSVVHPAAFSMRKNRRWVRRTFEKYLHKFQDSSELWSFVDFLLTNRPPFFIDILPYVKLKLSSIGPTSDPVIKRATARLNAPNLSGNRHTNNRAYTLEQLIKQLNNTGARVDDHVDHGGAFVLHDAPNKNKKGKTVSESEEDDKQYIERIKSNRQRVDTQRRTPLKKTSLDRTSKQVTFDAISETTPSDVPFNAMRKLSKRTKMKLFRRQSNRDETSDADDVQGTYTRTNCISEEAVVTPPLGSMDSPSPPREESDVETTEPAKAGSRRGGTLSRSKVVRRKVVDSPIQIDLSEESP